MEPRVEREVTLISYEICTIWLNPKIFAKKKEVHRRANPHSHGLATASG
jgi:hypothetical protein